MSSTHLSDLYIYPVKSTAGIKLQQSRVDALGLAFDRRFVVSDINGQFITARTDAKLCLIQASLSQTGISQTGIVLSAPNMPNLILEYEKFSTHYQTVSIWGDLINSQLCDEKANAWFSHYLQKPCQLLFFGQHSRREKTRKAAIIDRSNSHPLLAKTRQVAFADGYPLLLISQASLDNLNQRLVSNQHNEVSMAQFRPNIVINHCEAYAEDSWHHIKIGEVEFEVSKPCERCIFTTINPQNAEKHISLQPLKTLQLYRQSLTGEVLFGQNIVPLTKGIIKQGDPITIISRQSPPTFKRTVSAGFIAAKKQSPQGNKTMLTCKKIINETHNVKTFVFSTDSSISKKTIQHLAGQHINFTMTIKGQQRHCCYTIASSPYSSLKHENSINLTIKRVPNGKVSNYFHDHFNVGDCINAQPPSGNFHLPETIPQKVLLLSGGSGITPMLSMLRFMVEQKAQNSIVFFHSAHSEQDIIAKEEVRALAKQHGNCQVIYTLTQQTLPQWQGYKGYISEQMLTNIKQLTEHEVFVCGPELFRKNAQQHFRTLGLSRQKYHYESFGSKMPLKEQKITSSTELTTKLDSSKTHTRTNIFEKLAAKKINVLFKRWNKSYQSSIKPNLADNKQATILEQGEAAGLILPYSCRAGMCGSCKAKLISGEVKQLTTSGLSDSEKQQGYILTCSCIALSDTVIAHD
ncbi:MAG: MOSC domain-containing protein [Colwellia sp.]